LAKEFADTHHGNYAARGLMLSCFSTTPPEKQAECIGPAEAYLERYPHWVGSEHLWRNVLRSCTQAKLLKRAAHLKQRAAESWAHLWDRDEKELAFEVAKAWIEADEEPKALPWLKLVVKLDESGESRMAKEADELVAGIEKRHPGLASKKEEEKPLTKAEQQELAQKLFKKAAALPRERLKDFKDIYTEMFRRCPDAELTQRAYWRLSNLYLHGYDEPKIQELIALFEEFLKRYPDSKFVPPVRRRLIIAYDRGGLACKAADQERLALSRGEYPPQEDQIEATINLYAGYLETCGRSKEAAAWKKIQAQGGKAEEKIARAKAQGLLDY
jgi:hypothetical protein